MSLLAEDTHGGRSFSEALHDYLLMLNERGYGHEHYRFHVRRGHKLVKVLKTSRRGSDTSVVAFIDSNGDILPAASRKGPRVRRGGGYAGAGQSNIYRLHP